MKIKEFTHRNRRDFSAIYECEHCGHTEEKSGYDDRYFHQEVIPAMGCGKCGKTAPDDHVPHTPRYPESLTV